MLTRELDGHDFCEEPPRCDRCQVAWATRIMEVDVKKRVNTHVLPLYFCNACARSIEPKRDKALEEVSA